jgi:hypothetical protein
MEDSNMNTLTALFEQTNKAVDANITENNMPYGRSTIETAHGQVSCYIRPANDNRIGNRKFTKRVAQWSLNGKVISKEKLTALLSSEVPA